MNQSNSSLAMILLLVLSIIWGSAYWFIKHALKVFDPFELGMLRMTMAALALLPLALKDLRKLKREDLPFLFLVGLFGNFLPAVLFPLAQQKISSAEAGVLNSLSPLFIILVSFLVYKKRYPWVNVAGVLVGMIGAVILIVGGADGNLDFNGKAGYALFVVMATICYAISANVAKHHFVSYPPARLTSFAICFFGIPSVLYVLLGTDIPADVTLKPDGWKALGIVALLGSVMSGVAVIMFYKMLQVSSLVYASMVTFTAPIVVALLAVIDHETIGLAHIIGMAVILAGVFLVNRK
jgi:drug/metabolite transporter (DMT)-like permease